MKNFAKAVLFSALVFISRAAMAAPALDVPLPGGFLDLQYTAGSGNNKAYFVVDFGDNGGGTFAFKYFWPTNTVATPVQGLYSLINATGPLGSLSMSTSPTIPIGGPNPTSNYFLTDFGYSGNTTGISNPATKSWFMLLGDYLSSNVVWGDANTVPYGISGLDFSGTTIIGALKDNGFYGFRVGGFGGPPDFLALVDNPRVPVAVPEPATLVLAAFGAVSFVFVLRRRFVATSALSER